MKNYTLNILLFVFLVISIAAVSDAKTLIAGKIYNADWTETIPGAQVLVSCNHLYHNNTYINTQNTTSLNDGTYAVTYVEDESTGCNDGDLVKVDATKDSLYGSASGIVNEDVFDKWDIAIINVPLVPEFGLIAGALTLIASVVIFFVVRKE